MQEELGEGDERLGTIEEERQSSTRQASNLQDSKPSFNNLPSYNQDGESGQYDDDPYEDDYE